jgi:Protein of unknown function (DUF2970)
MTEQQQNQKKKGITVLSFMSSLFAGAFGVQSEKNRQRDFEHGKFSHFIIGGIIFAVLFVLVVYGIVQLVLSTAGA